METKSELKVVCVALAIIACQTLGIDISALAPLLADPDSLLSTLKAAHSETGTGWSAALVAGAYSLGRTYLKGRRQ